MQNTAHMSDEEFEVMLTNRAAVDQRTEHPIVPICRDDADGPINREATLDLPCYRLLSLK